MYILNKIIGSLGCFINNFLINDIINSSLYFSLGTSNFNMYSVELFSLLSDYLVFCATQNEVLIAVNNKKFRKLLVIHLYPEHIHFSLRIKSYE